MGGMRGERYMWMESPEEALNVIAELIQYEADIEWQNRWLKAAVELGFVKLEE